MTNPNMPPEIAESLTALAVVDHEVVQAIGAIGATEFAAEQRDTGNGLGYPHPEYKGALRDWDAPLPNVSTYYRAILLDGPALAAGERGEPMATNQLDITMANVSDSLPWELYLQHVSHGVVTCDPSADYGVVSVRPAPRIPSFEAPLFEHRGSRKGVHPETLNAQIDEYTAQKRELLRVVTRSEVALVRANHDNDWRAEDKYFESVEDTLRRSLADIFRYEQLRELKRNPAFRSA